MVRPASTRGCRHLRGEHFQYVSRTRNPLGDDPSHHRARGRCGDRDLLRHDCLEYRGTAQHRESRLSEIDHHQKINGAARRERGLDAPVTFKLRHYHTATAVNLLTELVYTPS